jgi:RNA polymerase sigma-70 factor (ECF subfamily)
MQKFLSDFGDKLDILVEASLKKGISRLKSDSVLISQIQTGNRDALAILYERYFPSVWRYVFSRLGGHEAASRDVVSETFLAMIQNIGRLNAASTNVAKWLSGVARHKLADHWRRSSHQMAPLDMELPKQKINPAAAANALAIRQAVGQAMDRVDDPQRIVLEWKYIDGLTVREIAERLERTEKAIEGILYRARAAFRMQYKRITQ